VSDSLDSELTHYYNFTITDAQASQIIINVARLTGDAQPTVLLALNRYPTLDDNDGPPVDSSLSAYELVVDHRSVVGRWTWAVINSPHAALTYTFTIKVNQCPRGCNGKGTCDPTTHVCTCQAGWVGTKDCSLSSSSLEPGVPITPTIPAFSGAFFRVAIPTSVNVRRTELRLQVVLPTLPVDGSYPRVYLNPDVVPSRNEFWMASRLPGTQLTEARVPSGDFGDLNETSWFALIDNLNSVPIKVMVDLDFSAHCVMGLSDSLGNCACSEGWLGEDCSLAPETGKVHIGVAVAIVLILFIVGMIIGFCLKKFRPQCCAAKRDTELDMQATADLGYAPAPGGTSA